MTHRVVALLITLALGRFVVSLAVAAQPSAHVPRIGLLSVFSPAIGGSQGREFPPGVAGVGLH
jgi:hypothetical protein